MRRALLLGLLATLALPAVAQATMPGANGKIAFSSTRDGDQEIYVMDNDGSNQTRLTNVPRIDRDPKWSPDGSRIAFTTNRNGPYDVYVMNPDGSGQTNLTGNLGGDQFAPTWSPDGTKIAFTHSTPGAGQRQLWTMNPDGSDQAVVTTSPVEYADWSPDGTTFVGYAPSHDRLSETTPMAAVNADGTGYHIIATVTVPGKTWNVFWPPQWTPDGSHMLFTATTAPGGCNSIARSKPDGSEAEELLTVCYPGPYYIGAAPSPDGTLLATNHNGIGLLDNDGNDVAQLTSDGGGPDWQPILRGYPRPKGAGTIHAPLVPAYATCTTPNRVHAAPLSFDSCNPPALTSTQLTLGTPDANGKAANSIASLRIGVIPGNPGTPTDEAEANLITSITDVRNASDLSDYTGNLEMRVPLQITDKSNTPYPGGPGPGTVQSFTFTWSVPCSATADVNIGSNCSLFTTADTLLPGSALETRRAIWETDRIEVRDGNGDPFLRQGIFVP